MVISTKNKGSSRSVITDNLEGFNVMYQFTVNATHGLRKVSTKKQGLINEIATEKNNL